MTEFNVETVERACGGRLISGPRSTSFSGVVIDSRLVSPGALFFALKGERSDGHDFVADAVRHGAAGAVVSRQPTGVPATAAVIAVDDTLRALGMLAAEHRRRFAGSVVAVTGSVGKTTARDMIAAVLSRRFRVLKPEGNMNTEIGVPLTVFGLSQAYDLAVFELAMRLKGEIAWLAGIVAPEIGVITNISETHLERLGSRENIAAAKAELLEALPANGLAVLNGDNSWIRRIRPRARCEAVFYGQSGDSAVSAGDVMVDESGTSFDLKAGGRSVSCRISIPGKHQAYNAMAAACVGLRFGMGLEEIRDGLSTFKPERMRSEISEAGGIRVMNDAYNASPVSTKAALATLAQVAHGRKVAVLGNMLELGDYAEQGHRETGETVHAQGIDILVTVGDLAGHIALGALAGGMDPRVVHRCSSNEEALAVLRGLLKAGDTVLVKGSRGARMEQVVAGLVEASHCDT